MRLHIIHHHSRRMSYEIDMLNGPVMPKLLAFAAPLILSSVLQLTFNAADVIVVGKFEGDAALAAVGAPGSLINLLVNLFLGLSVGANVVAAHYHGAGDQLKTSESVHTAMLMSLLSGLGVGVFGFFLAGMLLQHLHMEQIRFWHWLLLPVTLLPGLYVGMVLNEKISFYMFKLRIYHWFLLSALLLTVAVLLFARLFLDRPGYLAYLSRYSIVFLGTQFLWMRPLQFHLKDLELLDTTYAYQVLFAAAAVYILFTPLVYDLLKKYLPFLKLLNGEAL